MHNNKELSDWINNNFHYPIKANFHRANICTVENCIAGSPDQFVSNKKEKFRGREQPDDGLNSL